MKALAQDTLRIVREGKYVVRDRTIDIGDAVRTAIAGTVLHRPGDVAPRTAVSHGSMAIEVTHETTAAAGRRLAAETSHVCALNFASARNPGGGFLSGAKAQEEDLSRASALYSCLLPHKEYYDANRAGRSALYTDHVIYSPDVPFFRDDRYDLLDEPFLLSIITAPAPNAGAIDASERPLLRPTLERRAAIVLEIGARAHHRALVLGAWGCGVFANDPREVAEVFRDLLRGPFADAFDRIVLAVWDKSRERRTLTAFQNIFKPAT